jgi:hypothetical protein
MITEEVHNSLITFDEDTPLWRYLDLAKFLALIQNRNLLFSRLDKLGDPLEGLPTRANLDAKSHLSEIERKIHIDESKGKRDTLYASCWFIGQSESAGMWRSYPGLAQGIAIKTSRKDIIKAFRRNPIKIRMSRVNYIDRSREAILQDDIYSAAIVKGSFYQYENELRLLHWPGDIEPNDFDAFNAMRFPEGGIFVEVDLNDLINEVVVSPLAPQWFFDVVRSVLMAYGFQGLTASLRWSEMKEGILSL